MLRWDSPFYNALRSDGGGGAARCSYGAGMGA